MTKATASFQLRVVKGFLGELIQSVAKVVMACNYTTTPLSCKLEHGEPQGLWSGKGHTQSQAHITEYQATI